MSMIELFESKPTGLGVLLGALLGAVLLTGGCGFFDDVFDDTGADETETDTDNSDTDEVPEPVEGFRVFPQFMLQDVPAAVTIEVDADPVTCPLDGGGYLCDATGFPAGTVRIEVVRDGFDTAVRNPELISQSIESLTVHLSPAGGPTGTWSECYPAGQFETCGDVCTTEMLGCAVTSCPTGQDEWPVATYETYVDATCTEAVDSAAATCDDALPAAPAAAVRCCCL